MNIEQRSSPSTSIKNGLLLISSIFVTLAVAEILLMAFSLPRYMRPPDALSADAERELIHMRSSIPGLRYELVPNAQKYSNGAMVITNSYGMRDDEPVESGERPVCNIVALGDSFTFGLGVEGKDTYPNVLERLLNDKNATALVQVLNFGVRGYSSRDEALVLKHKAPRWNSELTIVGYYLNDPEIKPTSMLYRYYDDKLKLWQHSNIARLVAYAMRLWDILTVGNGDYYRYVHAERTRRWASVLSAFADIKETSAQQGDSVVLVIFPITEEAIKGWVAYPYRDLHRQVKDAAERNGFQVIDLYDAYSQYSPEDMMVKPGDSHPSKLAHTVAAKVILEAIEEADLLRCD